MSSTFGGLNTALTSLWAQQRALDITGQNAANVNTEGYSRKRADMQAVVTGAVPAIHSTAPVPAGGGVAVSGVTRFRDMFLEQRAQTESGKLAARTGTAAALSQIETAFGEPGDNGLQAVLADYWAGWGDVANQPGDEAARAQLLQRASAVADTFHSVAATLDGQWTSTRASLDGAVSDANATATQVASLNQAIMRATRTGADASDLSDQRDLLVMSLATSLGATTKLGEDGAVDVYVGGGALVSGVVADQLKVTGATDPSGLAAAPVQVAFVSSNSPADVGGAVGADLGTVVDTIPAFRTRLDGIAAALANQVNAAQAAGYDLDGNAGAPMFGGTPVTAASIGVSLGDPRGIAAASVATAPPAKPSLDGGNADAAGQLGTASGAPDAAYRSMIVDLGVQAQSANRAESIQTSITAQVGAARQSVAGVSLDEEMTNMVAYQHAYEAAARLVTSIDEMLDTLINRTGLVGR